MDVHPKFEHRRALATVALGNLLEKLMVSQCLPRRWTRRVCDEQDLPLRLQHVLRSAGVPVAWRAFTEGGQWWFAIARERGDPAPGPAVEFDACFFCQSGKLWAAGRWVHCPNEGFRLRELYDPDPSPTADAHAHTPALLSRASASP